MPEIEVADTFLEPRDDLGESLGESDALDSDLSEKGIKEAYNDNPVTQKNLAVRRDENLAAIKKE